MIRKLFLVCAILVITGLSSSEAIDAEITIFSGWSFLDIEEVSSPCIACLTQIDRVIPEGLLALHTTVDDSVLFGFRAGFDLNERAQVEGSFSVSPSHGVVRSTEIRCRPGEICPLNEITGFVIPVFFQESNMVIYQYDANFLYHFLNGDLRPYALFGVGGVSSDLQNDVRTDFSFNFGAGAKFYFDKIGLRFEVNDHVIPDHFLTGDTEHNLQVQYGFVFGL